MAWIRERKTRDGRRRIAVQWRESTGKVRSETLHTTDPRLVKMHLSIAERREGKAGAPPRAPRSALDALEAFLEEKALSVAAPTLRQYREKLGHLVEAWDEVPMDRWSRSMLVSYINERQWAPRTTQILIGQCQRFIAWAHASEIPCADFVGDFRGPPVRGTQRATLSLSQVRTLLEATATHYLHVPIALAAFAGLSRADLYALDWSEVLLDEVRQGHRGWLVRQRSKTGQPIRIPLIAPLAEILGHNLSMRKGKVCRLPQSRSSLTKALHRARKRAGIPQQPHGQGGWHQFRHSLGTVLGELGVHQAVIARVLAHAPGSTMAARYIHPDDSQVATAMERVGEAYGRAISQP